jgi:hypothetical protein
VTTRFQVEPRCRASARQRAKAGASTPWPRPSHGGLPQAEDRSQGFVDTPDFLVREMTGEIAEAPGVHGAELLDQDPGRLSVYLGCGPEGSSASAPRRWRHHDNRSRKELVGLHDHGVAVAVLLMADPLRESEAVDVTPEHEALPSSRPPPAFLPGRSHRLRAQQPPRRVLCCGEAGNGYSATTASQNVTVTAAPGAPSETGPSGPTGPFRSTGPWSNGHLCGQQPAPTPTPSEAAGPGASPGWRIVTRPNRHPAAWSPGRMVTRWR